MPFHSAGYAKYTDVEKNSIPLKTQGPTTQMIGDLPYKRLKRPVWFPDRHDDVTTPNIRHFASQNRGEGSISAVATEMLALEPTAASSSFGPHRIGRL